MRREVSRKAVPILGESIKEWELGREKEGGRGAELGSNVERES